MSSGNAVITSMTGGEVGSGWWGEYWYSISTSVQQGWNTLVTWTHQAAQAGRSAWNQMVAFARRPLTEQIVVLGDLATFGYFSEGLLSQSFGRALDTTDAFFAGASHALTAGLSTRARTAMYGETATRNHQGTAFNIGVGVGTVLGIAVGFANPCGATALIGAGIRGMNAIQAAGNALNAYDNIRQGNYASAAMDLLGVAGNVSSMLRACFVAGTPILTVDGHKNIEDIRVGDLVLSRDENDLNGPVLAKAVEECFVRVSPVLNLHVGGQVIGTTAEHPFYVEGKGWLACAELRIGDVLLSHDGQRVEVEGVADSGRVTTV